MKKPALHWQIIIGLIIGILWGGLSSYLGLSSFNSSWIKPFGTIFINLLKLIAVPLVLTSLITGISGLKDISKLSKMGGKTIVVYLFTTIIAIVIGLLLVNLIAPGHSFSEEKRAELQQKYAFTAVEKMATAEKVKESGPLQMLEDIVPSNIFNSMGDNTKMLQVIFFALLFGIAVIMLPHDKTKPVKDFMKSANEVTLKIVDVIMLFAPYGVFALMASLVSELAGDDPSQIFSLLQALGMYSITVVIGLTLMIALVYPALLKFFTGIKIADFFRGIMPAQMLAFSTSSSAAALPVNMECCEKNLGMKEEVTGFVLPLGATINMDGTSLYQAVAAVFIAQVFGMNLDLMQQLTIVVTAVLASIGAAPVPGAGMVMLVIILQSVGINPQGLALIFAVDRILDMCRTVVNVTSDATVAAVISHSQK